MTGLECIALSMLMCTNIQRFLMQHLWRRWWTQRWSRACLHRGQDLSQPPVLHMVSLSLLTPLRYPASSMDRVKQKTTHGSSWPIMESDTVPIPSLGKFLFTKNDFCP